MISRLTFHNSGQTETSIPRVIAIASGKGGVGKSITAFNLAAHLAHRHKVLLVDGDFFQGNLHLLANVLPQHSLADVAAGTVDLSRACAKVTERLQLLPGGNAGESLPDPKALAVVLGSLRAAAEHDLVIIDTAHPVLPQTDIILHAADEVILVTTCELTSISDCYALYKILIQRQPSLLASLLVNREDRRDEVEYFYEKFVAMTNQFLGHTPAFLGYLGNDLAVTDAVAHQMGIMEAASESTINRQFAALAEAISRGQRGESHQVQRVNINALEADIKE